MIQTREGDVIIGSKHGSISVVFIIHIAGDVIVRNTTCICAIAREKCDQNT